MASDSGRDQYWGKDDVSWNDEFLSKRDKNSDWMTFRVLSELYPFF